VGKRKITRIFLIGMLCGVVLAAAFTYVFAIPANSNYWRWEIWKRGGAAWTFDMKTGRSGWKWLVESKADTPPQKPATVPLSEVKVRTEKL
jgi:gas vesicle protein